jgi:hypothetical protein
LLARVSLSLGHPLFFIIAIGHALRQF